MLFSRWQAWSEATPLLSHERSLHQCLSSAVVVLLQLFAIVALIHVTHRCIQAASGASRFEHARQPEKVVPVLPTKLINHPMQLHPSGRSTGYHALRGQSDPQGSYLWMRSSEGVHTDVQGVARWETRTGLVARRPVAAKAPDLIEIDGVPVLVFHGARDGSTGLIVDDFRISQPFTVIAVSNPGGDATIMANGLRAGPHFELCHGFPLHGNRNPRIALVASGQGENPPDPPEQILHGQTRDLRSWHIYSAIADASNSELYVDGILEATGDAGPNGLLGLTIGADGSGDFGLNGGIVEIIIAKGRMAAATRLDLEGELAKRYRALLGDDARSHPLFSGFGSKDSTSPEN